MASERKRRGSEQAGRGAGKAARPPAKAPAKAGAGKPAKKASPAKGVAARRAGVAKAASRPTARRPATSAGLGEMQELPRVIAERDEALRRLDETAARLAELEGALLGGRYAGDEGGPELADLVPPAAGEGPGMKRFQSAESQRRFSREMREAGKRIAFVPTMGAFHAGHVSLIDKARAQNDVVVVSIFVNPLQFGPKEDYERYPRDLARDIDLCRAAGADAVFQPEVAEMLPEGFATRITTGPLSQLLCGAYRPGHFDGVCTIMAKLIGVVAPHRIYLGEKDAQQLFLIERMVRDLNMDVRLISCATVREPDGLAMSSRNSYLTPEQRTQAAKIYEALRIAQREILICHTRDPRELRELMREVMTRDSAIEIEYIEMVDPESLAPREVLEGRTLIAVRVRLGTAHLIDNILINVPGGRMAMGFETPGCAEGRPGGGPVLRRRG